MRWRSRLPATSVMCSALWWDWCCSPCLFTTGTANPRSILMGIMDRGEMCVRYGRFSVDRSECITSWMDPVACLVIHRHDYHGCIYTLSLISEPSRTHCKSWMLNPRRVGSLFSGCFTSLPLLHGCNDTLLQRCLLLVYPQAMQAHCASNSTLVHTTTIEEGVWKDWDLDSDRHKERMWRQKPVGLFESPMQFFPRARIIWQTHFVL